MNAIKLAADSNIDMIPQPYDELYRVLGFEAFQALFDYLGGQHVYIPTMRNVLSGCIRAQALSECGANVSPESVAKKYGYNGRYFRKLVSGK